VGQVLDALLYTQFLFLLFLLLIIVVPDGN